MRLGPAGSSTSLTSCYSVDRLPQRIRRVIEEDHWHPPGASTHVHKHMHMDYRNTHAEIQWRV